jgi:predicted DNA-binding protein (UPF0251 family)
MFEQGFAGKRLGIKRQESGQNFNRAGEKISQYFFDRRQVP